MEFDNQTGEPTVGFKLTTEGGSKMLRMTVANQPEGRFHRRMAIILDDKVLAPLVELTDQHQWSDHRAFYAEGRRVFGIDSAGRGDSRPR